MKLKYSLYFSTSILIFIMFFLYTITHFIGILGFDDTHLIFAIISLITTVILLFNFSIKELRKKIDKENYFKTLLLPLSYAFTNIIAFLIFADKETGWEYSYGIFITITWSILIFIILAVTNLVILSKQKNKN